MSTAPWDDPVSVALVAAQLIGRTTDSQRIALREARDLLRQAAYAIEEGKKLAEKERALAAFTAALLADMPMEEHEFIDQMVGDHCYDQRFDRRKEFFERRWLALCRQHPHTNPPGLDERTTLYTLSTLQWFYQLFQQVCRNEARKARTRKKLEKSS
jgi:hypothetical protein